MICFKSRRFGLPHPKNGDPVGPGYYNIGTNLGTSTPGHSHSQPSSRPHSASTTGRPSSAKSSQCSTDRSSAVHSTSTSTPGPADYQPMNDMCSPRDVRSVNPHPHCAVLHSSSRSSPSRHVIHNDVPAPGRISHS